MTSTDEAVRVAHLLLANSAMEKVSGYAARGRVWEAATLEDLNARFVVAYRARLQDVWSLDHLRQADDVEAEFRLRGLEPPFELVEPEALELLRRMQADIKTRMEEMSDEEVADANESMLREYAETKRSES